MRPVATSVPPSFREFVYSDTYGTPALQAYLAGSVADVAAPVWELLGARTTLHERHRPIIRPTCLEQLP